MGECLARSFCSIRFSLDADPLPLPSLPLPLPPNADQMGDSIQDQRLAIKWAHDHIAAFGGDPEKCEFASEVDGGSAGRGFPRASPRQIFKARSRLYRIQISQSNAR